MSIEITEYQCVCIRNEERLELSSERVWSGQLEHGGMYTLKISMVERLIEELMACSSRKLSVMKSVFKSVYGIEW